MVGLVATSRKPMSNWLKIEEEYKNMSRKTVTLRVSADTTIQNGTVLGKVFAGTATAAAFAGNSGDGAMGAITVSGAAQAGVYKLTIVGAATDAGAFTVEDPNGVEIGTGNVAAAFSAGGLAFTLADGATDFVVGDGFDITVVSASEKYTPAVETATDGSNKFAGIFMMTAGGEDNYTFTANTDYKVVIFEKQGMVSAEGLIFDSSFDTAAKKQVVYDAMEAKFIRVSTNNDVGYPAI